MQTKQWHIVLPEDLNNHQTLFGGNALKWMDEVAFIEATRHTGQKMVTAAIDNVRFYHPVKSGQIIEISGKIIHSGRVKLKIHIEIKVEHSPQQPLQKVVEACYTFVTVNDKNEPLRLKQVR